MLRFNDHLTKLQLKSVAWGSPKTDAMGELVAEWVAGLDLRLLNTGQVSTSDGRENLSRVASPCGE